MLNTKKQKLASAIQIALFVSAATLVSGTAFAQEQSKAKDLDRIEVTGSRIKRADVETTQPVQVVSREHIEATGLNNVFDILNNLTASDGSGLSTVTTATNGSDGSETISLRGLGSTRTLILVDGKRWAVDIDNTTDLSTIPTAIIERVEVLKDGASALYGSDAIGGVVNIITRRNYQGAEAKAYWGQTSKGDGTRTSLEVTLGAAGDRSSVVLNASQTTQDEIMAGNRVISRWGAYGCEALAARPDWHVPTGSTFESTLGAYCTSGFSTQGPFVVSGVGRVMLNPGAAGTDASDFSAQTNAHRYNYAPVNYLQQPSKRKGVFAAGHFDFNDNLRATFRAAWSNRTSDQQLAEVPMTASTAGTYGPQWQIPISKDSVFNPFGVDIGTWGYRSVPFGPRNPHYDYTTMSALGTLEGNFDIGERMFDWEVFAQYNDSKSTSYGTGYINLFNLRNAVGPSRRNPTTGALECLDSGGNVIRGCVPLNVFGGADLGLANGVISQEEFIAMTNYTGYTQVEFGRSKNINLGASLSGELFQLPGGMAGFALGVEKRKSQGFDQPDTLVASGGSSDNYREPSKGQVESTDYFAEIVLPLFSGLTGIKELELSAAARYSEIRSSGLVGTTFHTADKLTPTTSKFGLRWKPIDDLLVRASWGETFRSPSVYNLYRGGSESFPQVADICNTTRFPTLDAAGQARCMADGVPNGGVAQPNAQIRALLGGNPRLRPESGENWNVGIVWSPGFLEGFDISLDYWNIKLKDALTSRSGSAILTGCYRDGDPDMCALVERSSDGQISTLRTAQFNVGLFETAGVDASIGYRFNTENAGMFRFRWDTTYTRHSKTNGVDAVGDYSGSPNWEWRSTLTTGWARGPLDATWTIRHMSALTESTGWIYNYVSSGFDADALDRPSKMGATTYHDVQFGVRTPWNARVALGIRNVFGKEPPIAGNAFAHSFDGAYDLPGGGYYYFQYTQSF